MREKVVYFFAMTRDVWIIVILALIFQSAIYKSFAASGAMEKPRTISEFERKQLRQEVKDMFYHAWNGYMRCAFPKDELRPMSCAGVDSPLIGGYVL